LGGAKKGLKDAYFVQFEVSWGLKLKYFATLAPKYKLSPYPKKKTSRMNIYYSRHQDDLALLSNSYQTIYK
jgi:hypothetical protein